MRRAIFSATGFASPFNCFYSMPSVTTAACSQFWGLNGFQNTVVAACATGTIAIGEAYEVIRTGRAQMMLAGAGESLTSPCAIWNIDVLGALSKETQDPQRASCPFSAHRNGFVLSEGAAVLCLESREGRLRAARPFLAKLRVTPISLTPGILPRPLKTALRACKPSSPRCGRPDLNPSTGLY